MIPTEHEYNAATHAAARVIYERNFPPTMFPAWDDEVDLTVKRHYLQVVLPIVDAAISAIPDRREQVLAELRIKIEDMPLNAMSRSGLVREEVLDVLQ